MHIFSDAAGMEHHMKGVEERAEAAREFLEPQVFEIYGRPSDQIVGMMRQAAGSDVALTVRPEHLGGFVRLASG